MTNDWIAESARILSAPLRLVASGLDATLRLLGEGEPLARPRGASAGPRIARSPDGAASFDAPVTPRPAVRADRADDVAPSAPSPNLPPSADGTTSILPRSPETAFVFWTARPSRIVALRERIGARTAPLALRVRVQAPDAPDTQERIERLRPGADRSYVLALPAGARVEVTVGVHADGFHPVNDPVSAQMPHRSLSRRMATPTWRDHETGRDVTGYEAIAGTRGVSPRDLGRNLPPHPGTGERVTVETPVPNPRAVPARK